MSEPWLAFPAERGAVGRSIARLLVLGDSFSCGEGVGVRVGAERSWTGLLADRNGRTATVLATPGATVAELRRDQLPRAMAELPADVTLLIGINDVIRSGYDPAAVAHDLEVVARQLARAHRTLIVGRWHDPTVVFPVPGRLRAHIVGRVGEVNAALDAAAAAAASVTPAGRVRRLDLAQVPELTLRCCWAVDRVHPSGHGHAAIAAAAARSLAATPVPLRRCSSRSPVEPHPGPCDGQPELQEARGAAVGAGCLEDTCAGAPGRLAELRWLAGHGVPWLGRRFGRVAVPVATLAVGRGR